MTEVKDVIVDISSESESESEPLSQEVQDKIDEAMTIIEKADDIVDEAINDAVDTIVSEANDKVEEIKNENTKLAAEVAMSVVNQVTDNKEEMIDKATDKVFEVLLEQAKDVGVKKSTIAILIKYVMEAVEDTPLKGAEQKDYALRLIRSLVVELADDEDKEYLLIAIDSGSVSTTIDLIVAATKGELNVNMVVESAATSCLPCITGVIAKCCKKE